MLRQTCASRCGLPEDKCSVSPGSRTTTGGESKHRISCSESAFWAEVAMSGEPVARRRYYSPFEVTSGHLTQAGRVPYKPLQTAVFICRCLSTTHHRTAGCRYWAKFSTSPLLSRCMAAVSAILSISCAGRATQLYLLSLQAQQGVAAAPLVAAAGTDISHWYML